MSTLTAQDIVQTAMEQLGILSSGEKPTGDELDLGLRHLDLLLSSFTARGANLWRETTALITFPANTASVALVATIEDVLDARLTVAASYERQLFRIERGSYNLLPNKSAPGQPIQYYIDRQRDQATMYVWPVPQATTVITADVLRVIDPVVDPDQTIDVPVKWQETVALALAARLASAFGVTRIDPATASVVAQRAQAFEQLLLDDDRPSSIIMGAYGGRDA